MRTDTGTSRLGSETSGTPINKESESTPILSLSRRRMVNAAVMNPAVINPETYLLMGVVMVKHRAPWRTGAALAVTMAVSYTVCTLAYAQWPQAGIEFLNALFHGLDFNQLGVPAPLTVSMFIKPLLVLSLWGFLVGALFGWLQQLLYRGN